MSDKKPDKHSDIFDDKAFADFIHKLPEIKQNNELVHIIASPVDTGRLRDSIKVDDKPYNRTKHPDIKSWNVIESSFVEPGTAYLVPQPSTRFNPTVNLPDGFDMEYINERFRQTIAMSFGIPSRYFEPAPHKPIWQRMEGESLVEWGNRLEKIKLLDNPEYRWEYQKAVLKAVFVIPVQVLIDKIRGALHE